MMLCMERLLRLIQLVTQHNAPTSKVLEFITYLIPHYLGLALPASLFLGILLGIRRLQDDSELAIIQAVGVSPRRLYAPVAMIIIPAIIIMFILTGYAQPLSRYAYRINVHNLSTENPLNNIRPKVFTTLDEDLTIRVDKVNANQTLEGIFIVQNNVIEDTKVMIVAKQALMLNDSRTQERLLLFQDGSILKQNLKNNTINEITFKSYPWSLNNLLTERYGPRGQDEREMNFQELVRGHVATVKTKATQNQISTELHSRVIQSLTLIFLALWAIPLALIGSGRTGKATGILAGVALLIFYEKLLGLGEAYAAQGLAHNLVALWLPFAIFGTCGFMFMHYKMPNFIHHTKASTTQPEAP